MANPKVVRETDYPSLDYSNIPRAIFDAMKDALVTHFGWVIDYEDLVSADVAFVARNQGSGYCVKVIHQSGDSQFLAIQCAQSFSDINTPVNPYGNTKWYIYLSASNPFWAMVGDDKCVFFSCLNISSLTNAGKSGNANGRLYHFGDFINYRSDITDNFILTSNYPDIENGTSSSSSSYPGVLIDDSRFGTASLTQQTEASKLPILGHAIGFSSCGANVFESSSYWPSSDAEIRDDSPSIMQPSMIEFSSVADTPDGDRWSMAIGQLPGLYRCYYPIKSVYQGQVYDVTTIAGTDFICLPKYGVGLNVFIKLTDWWV